MVKFESWTSTSSTSQVQEVDTCIPLNAVVRRAGDPVFVNVAKLVVGEMPWGEPPTRSEHKMKDGPPAAQLKKLYDSRAPSAHR